MGFEQCSTDEERVEYFKGHAVTVESHACLDGSKKVGDTSAVRTLHRPMCRGVIVGGWYETASEAAKAGEGFLSGWDGSMPE